MVIGGKGKGAIIDHPPIEVRSLANGSSIRCEVGVTLVPLVVRSFQSNSIFDMTPWTTKKKRMKAEEKGRILCFRNWVGLLILLGRQCSKMGKF